MQYEFVEQGELRGASLIDRSAGVIVALRLRELCASKPCLDGFDPVAFAVESAADLHAFAAHCDAHDVQRTEIRDAQQFGQGLDVTDPDGTILRFLCESPQAFQNFVGISISKDGPPELYHEPRPG
jgi:hypothetical protein